MFCQRRWASSRVQTVSLRGIVGVAVGVDLKVIPVLSRKLPMNSIKAPQYLSNYCVPVSKVVSRQQLRSASRRQLLLIPRYRITTVCQRQCSLLSHWTFFDAAWKLNCSSVLTTDTAPVKRLYCCVTHFHFPAAFFLLWLQPWSLSTIMLLWHSFLIIIIIIIRPSGFCCGWPDVLEFTDRWTADLL